MFSNFPLHVYRKEGRNRKREKEGGGGRKEKRKRREGGRKGNEGFSEKQNQ